ncbi:MAG: hypothetical protein AAGC93_30110, partial [Cyanobacteria bacterium P01_F01_bin.53]
DGKARRRRSRFGENFKKNFALSSHMVPRGFEIDAWLKSNIFNGLFYILDDRDDMEPHQGRLVQTQ